MPEGDESEEKTVGCPKCDAKVKSVGEHYDIDKDVWTCVPEEPSSSEAETEAPSEKEGEEMVVEPEEEEEPEPPELPSQEETAIDAFEQIVIAKREKEMQKAGPQSDGETTDAAQKCSVCQSDGGGQLIYLDGKYYCQTHDPLAPKVPHSPETRHARGKKNKKGRRMAIQKQREQLAEYDAKPWHHPKTRVFDTRRIQRLDNKQVLQRFDGPGLTEDVVMQPGDRIVVFFMKKDGSVEEKIIDEVMEKGLLGRAEIKVHYFGSTTLSPLQVQTGGIGGVNAITPPGYG